MAGTATRLGVFAPRCELCGGPAPPRHGSARRGAFLDVRSEALGMLEVWACEACGSPDAQLLPRSITPPELQTLKRVRSDQGAIADREVLDATGLTEKDTSRDAARLDAKQISDWHLLCSVRGLGPVAAAAVHSAGLTATEVIEDPTRFPLKGKRAATLVKSIGALTRHDRETSLRFAESQLLRAADCGVTIIGYEDGDYPPLVRVSKNPIPILWVRGNLSILHSRRAIACVGSRRIRKPYSQLQEAFVEAAVQEDFVIVSGFAMGADSIGHRRALQAGGSTICVMPCGADRIFPPENRSLWHQLMDSGRAVFVSEFALGRGAEKLTLRKRNKLIVAASQGVLVAQSSCTGGAMNAFRSGLEQKKPIATFDPDGTDETSGNEEIRSANGRGTSAFPMRPATGEYRQWLTALSSST